MRFLSRHRNTITYWPLQTYSSAILFTPDSSVLRTENIGKIPPWVLNMPTFEYNWASLTQTINVHLQRVRTVLFSPDGKYLASGSDDTTMELWDNTTGDHYRTLGAGSARVKTMAFSPDSKKIVFGSGASSTYKRIRAWNSTKAEIQRISMYYMGFTRTPFRCNKNIQILDVTTGEILKTLEGHSGSVNTVVFSPDGEKIASGSFDRMVKIWNATTGELQRILIGHSRPVRSVAFSKDGKQIASGSSDSTIRIWDTTTGELLKIMLGHSGPVKSVVFSPDGKQIASGSFDRKVRLWDAVTGELQKTLVGHTRSINTVAFSPDGKYVASGSSDTMINLWDTTTGDIKKVLATRADPIRTFQMMWTDEVRSLAFTSDGKAIVSGSGDSSIRRWDINMENDQRIPEGHSSWVLFVSFSPNGEQIVSGSIDGYNYLKFWDVTTGDLQRTFKSEEIFLKAPSYAIIAFLRGMRKFNFQISRLKPRQGFSLRNQWIFYEGYPVLLLPSDFRPACFDVLGDQIAVGFLNGRVLSFAIDRSRVQSILGKEDNSLTSVSNNEGVE